MVLRLRVVGRGFMFKVASFFALLCTGTLFGANSFPLQSGNSWTYQVAGQPRLLTVQVGAPATVNDRTYFPVSGYAEKRVLVRYEADQLLYLDEETGREAVLTSFLPGAAWTAPFRQCQETGEAQGQRVTHDGPAGPIENVLEIRYVTSNCADAGTISEQFAENLGMLRRTVQSIAGPRRWDLVEARVGRAKVETAHGGRFVVSADTGGAGAIAVTLRIDLEPGATVTLPFSSGQEYDIVLRDDAGRVVYTWSAAQSFIQSLHNLTVTDGWITVVAVPRPAPGSYTLQAWMTTSGGASRYAATMPMTIEAARL